MNPAIICALVMTSTVAVMPQTQTQAPDESDEILGSNGDGLGEGCSDAFEFKIHDEGGSHNSGLGVTRPPLLKGRHPHGPLKFFAPRT
ncbi:hypothetical protein RB195_001684 [Necator americanus]